MILTFKVVIFRLSWRVRMGYLFPAGANTSVRKLGTFVSDDRPADYRMVWLVAACLGQRSFHGLTGANSVVSPPSLEASRRREGV